MILWIQTMNTNTVEGRIYDTLAKFEAAAFGSSHMARHTPCFKAIQKVSHTKAKLGYNCTGCVQYLAKLSCQY